MSSDHLISLRNHLQVSYGEAHSNQRQTPEDKWNFTIGTAIRPMVEWRAELNLAAVQIQGLFRKTPLLYVDGSFASQVMVQAFRWSKGQFSCVVPRFLKDFNRQAFSQAILFLESIEVPYEVIDVNLEEFLISPENMEWTQKYSTDLPGHLVAMKMWQYLAPRQLPVIFPMGLPQFKKTTEGWKVLEFEKEYGLLQFQKDQNFLGVSCFFKWAPETVMSLLLDPTLRSFMTNIRKETAITEKILKEIFQNYYPIAGDKNWTGFEGAEFTVKRFHQTTKANQKGPLTAYSFPFADYCARLNYNPPAEESASSSSSEAKTKVHLG